MLSLSGHLGDRVAALVDGQLSAEQEERAWSHALACPGCRGRVEAEVHAQRLLRGLRYSALPPAPAVTRPAYAVPGPFEPPPRRLGVALAGGATTVVSVLALAVAGGLVPAATQALGRAGSTPLTAVGSLRGAVPQQLAAGTRSTPVGAERTIGTPTGGQSVAETVPAAMWSRTSR